ncbi:MAG: hypothetical protein ACOCX2_03950 [Armatimonadota bacterium]
MHRNPLVDSAKSFVVRRGGPSVARVRRFSAEASLPALLCALLVLATTALAQDVQTPVPATDVVNWDFEDGSREGWRHKDNATIEVVDAGGERGNVLEFATDYGEFGFAWMTMQPGPRMDFSDTWAVEFMIRGDGSGAIVRPTLGVIRRGEPTVYYSAERDALTLDFTGWRRHRLHISALEIQGDRNILEDLQRISFVQFMVNAEEASRTTLAVDDIHAAPPEGEQVAQFARWREEMARLFGPVPKDGSNLLPNGGFERSADGETPQFWRAVDWGTESEMRWQKAGGRDGSACVAVHCPSVEHRGSYQINVSVEPGPYVFSARARCDLQDPEAGQGARARISYINEEGRGIGNDYCDADHTADGWQHIRGTFEVQSTIPRVQINLFNSFGHGTVYWDDVSLAWDVELTERRERIRRQNLADLAEVRPMIVHATQELAVLTERIGEPDQYQAMALAMLEWALQDAEYAMEAELGTNAKATVESAREYIAGFDEIMAEARANPLRTAPPDADANPYVASLNAGAAAHSREPTGYRKGEEGYLQVENAWSFRTLGSNCLQMAWALTHPRSEHHGDPLLVKNLFDTMQGVLQNHRDGDWNPGRQARFGADPNIPRFTLGPTFDAYRQLRQHLPWLILPAKDEEWLDEIRVCVEHQYEEYGLKNFTTGAYGAGNYPNQDVYYLLICELAHRVWGDEKFADHVQLFLDFLEDTVYPMGGMIYHGTQNETFGYHNLNISWLARFLEYTGSEQARRIIAKTVDFYPIMVEPSGIVENYTDASWKHSPAWAHPQAPDIVAAITGDPLNKRVANIAIERSGAGHGEHSVFAAEWWKDIPEEPLPDNYIMFDENVQGPRARFGPFSFAMNGRNFGEGRTGKDTFIGCTYAPMGLPEGEVGALLIAIPETRIRPEGIHYRNARYITGLEEFAHIIGGNEFASMAVRYRTTIPRRHDSPALPWQGTQQWFASKDRLVGLIHITAVEEDENAGVWGRLRFGRATGENEIIPSPEMEDTFKYGPLLARIHAHNYDRIETAPGEMFYLDEPERFRARELLLKDAESATPEEPDKRTTYPAGTDYWFLAEVMPYTSDFASAVEPIHDGDVRGLRFSDSDGAWIVLHNLSERERQWSGSVPEGAAVRLFVQGEHGNGQLLGRQAAPSRWTSNPASTLCSRRWRSDGQIGRDGWPHPPAPSPGLRSANSGRGGEDKQRGTANCCLCDRPHPPPHRHRRFRRPADDRRRGRGLRGGRRRDSARHKPRRGLRRRVRELLGGAGRRADAGVRRGGGGGVLPDARLRAQLAGHAPRSAHRWRGRAGA